MFDTLEYIGEIVPKPRMTRADTWKHRPIVDSYYAFKDSLVLQANMQNFVLGDAYSVVFRIPMPTSWSKVKRESYMNTTHNQRPDCDNLVKALQDSLLQEDSKVWHISATKIWTAGESRIDVINLDDSEKEDILQDILTI